MEDLNEITVIDNEDNEVELQVKVDFDIFKPSFKIVKATVNDTDIPIDTLHDRFDSMANLHDLIKEELNLDL